MQNSDQAAQIFEISEMENVWLTQKDDTVWTYKIGPDPVYLSKSKKKLVLCILLSILIIITALFVWSAKSALFGAFIAIFLLPLLEIMTVLTYSIALVSKKEEAVTIDRAAGTITTKRRRWRGMEDSQEYSLKDFTTVTCSPFTTTEESKRGTQTSTYFTVSLLDDSEPFEIFCARHKTEAREHARSLAEFLNVTFSDETPV